MGKRAGLAFFISLLVIISYNYIIAQKYPPQEQAPEVISEERVLPSPFVAQTPSVAQAPSSEEKNAFNVATVKQAKEIVVQTDLVRLVITSSGARIKSCQLKNYPEERITSESVQTQLSQIEQSLLRASSETKELLQREKRKLEILWERVEQDPQMAELVSLSATVDADFSPAIVLPENEQASMDLNTAIYHYSKDFLSLSQGVPEGRVEFRYTDLLGRQIKKVYSFSNYNYNIGLDISFSGWQKKDFPEGYFLLYYGPDVGLPQAQQGRRIRTYEGPVTFFEGGQQGGWVSKEKYARQETGTFVRREHQEGRVVWTGLENKYFLTALIPTQLAESVITERNSSGEQKVAVKLPWQGLSSYGFQLYLGPKKEEWLKQAGASLEKTIDYGFFGPIARLIYRVLGFFSRWTNNFGWAIVLLCLATKIVFYPLTHRSFESMQKMQLEMKTIQPEMNALREKLKDNPQKLNKEIMELYRKKGVNPLASCQSGCLPMVLQMPVFFALYAVLYNSIELRGTPFLWWIEDLSAKDPYYILPIFMGISMFVQQKLTGMGTTGGAQQEQAKMMSVLMPIFLTWIFASLPSGVVLYWFTFNIVTALQQLLIRKKQQT